MLLCRNASFAELYECTSGVRYSYMTHLGGTNCGTPGPRKSILNFMCHPTPGVSNISYSNESPSCTYNFR